MLLEIELGNSDSRGTLGRGRMDRGEMEIERESTEKEKIGKSETKCIILSIAAHFHNSQEKGTN